MDRLKAFVGHSFDEKDQGLVQSFLSYFDSLKDTTGLEWDHAEKAEPKELSRKVREKMENKDLFIGIFTKKDNSIEPDKLKGIRKYYLGSKADNFRWGSSEWIIQESGYALAKGMELILLKEKDVYITAGLQGDIEFIPFARENPDACFKKINEMIGSMIGSKKSKGAYSEKQESTEDLEKREIERQEEEVKQEIKEKKQDAFDKLANAIFNEKDYVKAQKIYEEELATTLLDDEKEPWRAIVLKYSHGLGDKEAFSKLEKLAEENKYNPEVVWQLAVRYKEMREFKKAKEKYLQISTLYDPKQEDDRKGIVNCYKQASLCLAYDGKYDEAIELQSELLFQESLKEYKVRVLAGLATIAKTSDDSEKFCIYAEGSLNLDSSDSDLRFDLAYRYSQTGHVKLSLLHYKKLTDTIKSLAGLNNLGVAYETLGLSAKSIRSYSDAAELNHTLAMANIAQRYLDGGFVEDAKSQIRTANDLSKEGIEIHGNIGLAKNRLDKILEDEEEKEKQLLIEAEKEREFRTKYSEAYYFGKSIVKDKFEGIWKTPLGNLELIFDEKQCTFAIEKTIEEKVEASTGLAGLVLHGATSGKERIKKKNIKGIVPFKPPDMIEWWHDEET